MSETYNIEEYGDLRQIIRAERMKKGIYFKQIIINLNNFLLERNNYIAQLSTTDITKTTIDTEKNKLFYDPAYMNENR